MQVKKRNGNFEPFDKQKITSAIQKAFLSCDEPIKNEVIKEIVDNVNVWDGISIEDIQDEIIELLCDFDFVEVAQKYSTYRDYRNLVRHQLDSKKDFITKYKESSNTANATIDDNSNVGGKNIGILNAEIHKSDNLKLNRDMVTSKLKELFPEFDSGQYSKDLNHHIIYKHDESSFAGAIAPYCVSMTMYPFLLNGIKDIGGLSAAPKNLDSFCGMYINLIFATSAMFAGAVATSEFFLYFDYFARKEWGDDYYTKCDNIITNSDSLRTKTIKNQIHQYFQQVIYSINQPAAARGLQSASIVEV